MGLLLTSCKTCHILLVGCRGQVVRVKAPWIKHYYNNDGKFYVIPNLETVVLGGTTQKGSWDTSINEQVQRQPLLGHLHTARGSISLAQANMYPPPGVPLRRTPTMLDILPQIGLSAKGLLAGPQHQAGGASQSALNLA